MNWFQICLILEVKFEDDLWSNSCQLKQIKVNLLQEEATEIESIDFAVCCATRLKDDIYTVTIIISIEILISNIYSRKSMFLSKGNQKIWLIIKMTI